jgi:hypothetical protein
MRDAIDTSLYVRNNQWQLKDTKAELRLIGNGSHDTVVYQISLARRSRYYLVNLIVPAFTLTLLTLFNFYLPPQSGQKVTLGVIVLLCLSLYQLVLAGMIPTMSSCLPIISAYFSTLTTLSVLSLIMTILVLNIHYAQPNNSHTPKWVHFGVCKCLAWLLCMKRSKEKKNNKKKNTSRVKVRRHTEPTNIYHVNPPSATEPADSNEISSEDESPSIEVRKDPQQGPHQTSGMNSDHQGVLDELRLMNERLGRNMMKEEQREEWQYAAMVIDRLCFCISSFIFFVSMAGIFILMATDHTTHQ